MAKLQKLDLTDTQATDATLKLLQRFTDLKDIRLDDTKVTGAGVEELQKALPNARKAKPSALMGRRRR